jgi:hypothetical protein
MLGRIRIRRGLRRSSVHLITGAGFITRWFIDDGRNIAHFD